MAAEQDCKVESNVQHKLLVKLQCTYTSSWCEENAYKMAETAESYGFDMSNSFVVLISNENKTVPCLRQRASDDPDGKVVWDYHVIFLSANTGSADGPFLYDLDTTLPFPCPALRYLLETCSPQSKWPKKYEHRFRVVPASEYLACFSSDRSHMMKANGKFMKTPPNYPPIKGKNAASKMMLPKFWDMKEPSVDGCAQPHAILDLRGLIAFIRTLPA